MNQITAADARTIHADLDAAINGVLAQHGLEEALGRVDTADRGQPTIDGWAEGLYELTGPAVGPNPETYIHHVLVPVDVIAFPAPTDIEGLTQFDWRRHPAVVWHHPDGRRARLSATDLNIRHD